MAPYGPYGVRPYGVRSLAPYGVRSLEKGFDTVALIGVRSLEKRYEAVALFNESDPSVHVRAFDDGARSNSPDLPETAGSPAWVEHSLRPAIGRLKSWMESDACVRSSTRSGLAPALSGQIQPSIRIAAVRRGEEPAVVN
jgi:hypothetical protein